MKLYDYLCERFCIQEEDKKDLQKGLKKWELSSVQQMYKKNPPYLMEPFMKQIERDMNRYKNMGGKVGG